MFMFFYFLAVVLYMSTFVFQVLPYSLSASNILIYLYSFLKTNWIPSYFVLHFFDCFIKYKRKYQLDQYASLFIFLVCLFLYKLLILLPMLCGIFLCMQYFLNVVFVHSAKNFSKSMKQIAFSSCFRANSKIIFNFTAF